MTHKVMDLDPITFNKSTSSELAQYYIGLHTQFDYTLNLVDGKLSNPMSNDVYITPS